MMDARPRVIGLCRLWARDDARQRLGLRGLVTALGRGDLSPGDAGGLVDGDP